MRFREATPTGSGLNRSGRTDGRHLLIWVQELRRPYGPASLIIVIHTDQWELEQVPHGNSWGHRKFVLKRNKNVNRLYLSA